VKARFEVRSVEAWAEGEGGWTWNASCRLFDFRTGAKDVRRAFLGALRRHGIRFRRGRVRVETLDGGYTYEVQARKDGEPLYAAIYMEEQ
jgi:hypothetical protein